MNRWKIRLPSECSRCITHAFLCNLMEKPHVLPQGPPRGENPQEPPQALPRSRSSGPDELYRTDAYRQRMMAALERILGRYRLSHGRFQKIRELVRPICHLHVTFTAPAAHGENVPARGSLGRSLSTTSLTWTPAYRTRSIRIEPSWQHSPARKRAPENPRPGPCLLRDPGKTLQPDPEGTLPFN